MQHLQWLLLLGLNCLILSSHRKTRHAVSTTEGQVRSVLFGIMWIRGMWRLQGLVTRSSSVSIRVPAKEVLLALPKNLGMLRGSIAHTEIYTVCFGPSTLNGTESHWLEGCVEMNGRQCLLKHVSSAPTHGKVGALLPFTSSGSTKKGPLPC